ncbi:radical SAM domain-containing protein [Thermoclostridium stercorarium subsp. stercorarium DSM 8532]|uniref:Radical SAM domain-containing protein n=1 Tax=Thermoclostridium stercorarium (strain ATCC 35414 / DSM 8532 / NCIMB 11754) TaxID=1121335 RepID=L7VI50_THES1|nr:[FeFe] hydrogenase H-cluster radical SAM maturase HydE [Thermoclostridium stercorarium]AGC67710.1 radical SAM domain-containing protein [Thermoclostridium stercorarium subsp. stercorarium DSM 8532]AGI38754.1 HydE [Thermoclostridium stercorarium subsp. stercorarium DSM 8532]
MKQLVDKLYETGNLSPEEYKELIDNRNPEIAEYLFEKARNVRIENYGYDVYIRGLIEFTNYCRNDCFYCGIRKSNIKAERYRLTKEQILECCDTGYELGFRTFVLQGGEDEYFTDDKIVDIIRSIKVRYPDCAVTLSIGERSYESYKAFFDAGADRYLLRHETADYGHYRKLHPRSLSFENRMQCLFNLKEIGYQVGCGFMVGSPFQTTDCLVEDLLFIKKLNPHMVGIGPFIPHHATPFADKQAGTLELTLFLLGIIRLMLPDVLLPATTALGTIHPKGREMGILAGANVVMPNLSPKSVRKKYMLYDNKICTGDEAAECISCMRRRMESIGYRITVSRGDHKSIQQ